MAQTFMVPAGSTPSAVSVLTSPLATWPTVPSPPTANTAWKFSAAACRARLVAWLLLNVSTTSTLQPAACSGPRTPGTKVLIGKRPAAGLYSSSALRMSGL